MFKLYASRDDFLNDEDGVWQHLDKYALQYCRNPMGIRDFCNQIDKMTHAERVKLIVDAGFIPK